MAAMKNAAHQRINDVCGGVRAETEITVSQCVRQ